MPPSSDLAFHQDLGINSERLQPQDVVPEEERLEQHRPPHGFKWAPSPKDFFLVDYSIVVNPTKELQEKNATAKPQIVPPFPSLSTQPSKSRLRNGKEIWSMGYQKSKNGDGPATFEKLEEYLPSECFPDVLEVHNISMFYPKKTDPVLYHRAVPGPWIEDPMSNPPRKSQASLILWQKIGGGNHGAAFRASLSLPALHETLQGSKTVNVAVKLCDDDYEAMEHFKTEVESYSLMSRPSYNYLQMDWSGYVVCTGQYGAFDMLCPDAAPLSAVVPKFFGLYEEKEGAKGPKGRLLLMEDCGQSLSDFVSSGDLLALDTEERDQVWNHLRIKVKSIYSSLHQSGFLHGSVKRRNFTIQPGPLCLPAVERSYRHPSFRIIDFGRTEVRRSHNSASERNEFGGCKLSGHEFQRKASSEMEYVLDDLVFETIKKSKLFFERQQSSETAKCQD